MPMFQIVPRASVNDPDGTFDHLVRWVLARDIDVVIRAVGGSDSVVTALDLSADQCLPDVDFVLPRESRSLAMFLLTAGIESEAARAHVPEGSQP